MRQFWGVTWHQLLRKFLTANSKFITSILLPDRATRLVARCICLFIIFFIPGLLHTATDWTRGIPIDESGSPVFFPFHALIMMMEEVARYLFRPISRYFGHRMK